MNFLRAIFLSVSLIFLFACTTTDPTDPSVVGHIETFVNINKKFSGDVYITGSDKNKESLEFATYKRKIVPYLENFDFKVIDQISEADLVVIFDYGIGNEIIRTGSHNVWVWGPTGGGTSTISGNKIEHDPDYGMRRDTKSYEYSQYPRFVTLDFFEADTKEKVYEMTLKSQGSCNVLSEMMDEFIEAIFLKFPNNSGPF